MFQFRWSLKLKMKKRRLCAVSSIGAAVSVRFGTNKMMNNLELVRDLSFSVHDGRCLTS